MLKLGLAAVLLISPAAAVVPAAAGQAAPTPGQALAASWQAPLHTEGRWIVDAAGNRFRLQAGNWNGGSGTWNGSGDSTDPANNHSGEVANQMPLGLDRAPIPTILAGFHELGINAIRLQFSNQMIHDTTPVQDAWVKANPGLKGKTPVQVYDAVVKALTDDGFAVILNNHTNTSKWCCGLDGNERWNSSQSTGQWEDDWVSMARRYKDNPRVVGADLYNEVRRDVWDDPNWGLGDAHDWYAASAEAGDRILTEANPQMLIIVEGINWYGLPIDGFPHGRPDLTPVSTLSHTLVASDKLVYSAHFYGYTGPNHSGATGIGETTDPRYRDMSAAEMMSTLTRQAFYVTQDQNAHYTHPVWVSEFGVGRGDGGDAATTAWFRNFVDDLIAVDADFAYWPLVGWQANGQGDSWSLQAYDPDGKRISVTDDGDWRRPIWQKLIDAKGKAGHVDAQRRWNMLALDHTDQVASLRVRAGGDFDSGARKGVCPDGERLTALSHTGNHGLCVSGEVSWGNGGATTVNSDKYVGFDWAGGYTKFQCPDGAYAIGFSVKGTAVSSLLCAPAANPIAGNGRTVWFDRSDDRPAGESGGEFAWGNYKGQCATNEYVAGVAFTGRFTAPQKYPAALYCRSL